MHVNTFVFFFKLKISLLTGKLGVGTNLSLGLGGSEELEVKRVDIPMPVSFFSYWIPCILTHELIYSFFSFSSLKVTTIYEGGVLSLGWVSSRDVDTTEIGNKASGGAVTGGSNEDDGKGGSSNGSKNNISYEEDFRCFDSLTNHCAAVTQGGVVYTWGCGNGGRLGHIPMINMNSLSPLSPPMEVTARELIHLPAVNSGRQIQVLQKWRRAHSVASHVHITRTKGNELSLRERASARLIQGDVVSSFQKQIEIAVVGGGK
jgi:hypothetical protein